MHAISVMEVRRRQAGLTRRDLAALTGILQVKLSLIEGGHVAALEEEARKITASLGCRREVLFTPHGGDPHKYRVLYLEAVGECALTGQSFSGQTARSD